jgi:hypothetical protein
MNLDSKTKRNERKKLISPMFVSASPSSYDSSPQYTPTLLDRSEEMLSEVKTYSVMEQELFVQQRDEQLKTSRTFALMPNGRSWSARRSRLERTSFLRRYSRQACFIVGKGQGQGRRSESSRSKAEEKVRERESVRLFR